MAAAGAIGQYSDVSDEDVNLDSPPSASFGGVYFKKKARFGEKDQNFELSSKSVVKDSKRERKGWESISRPSPASALVESVTELSKAARKGWERISEPPSASALDKLQRARKGWERISEPPSSSALDKSQRARKGWERISEPPSSSALDKSTNRSSSPTAARKGDDALFSVCDDQGWTYHAFMEVCDKVFAGIPRQTIKSRMRNLGLTLVQCPSDIQDCIRRSRPQLASFRVISLISKRDLSVLQAYHESRMQNERKLRMRVGAGVSAFSVVERGFSRETASYGSPAVSFGSAVNQMSPVATASNFSIDHILGNTASPAERSVMHEPATREDSSGGDDDGDGDGDGDDDDDDDDDWQSLDEDSSTSESSDASNDDDGSQHYELEIVRLLKKRNVDISSFKDVIASLSEMKDFYLAEFNHKRRSPKMSESSWQKHLERVIMYLAYCATSLKLGPALSLVDDLSSVEGFINHIKQKRRVQNSTAAAYVQSLLVAAKFIHAGDSRKDYAEVASVSDLRSLQNQLNKSQRRMSKNPSVKLLWPQFQEVVRTLHCKYEETSGVDSARVHMNFTMLLLFAVNPGRSRELRTLRLSQEALHEREIDKLIKGFPEGENTIIFSSEGPVWLIERDYKTAAKYGPVVVKFDTGEYQFVSYHLKRYKEVSRPRLLSEVKHDYFFVNMRGGAFKSSGSFSKYLSKIFQEYLGFACSTNEMRHSLVEHFRSSPESSDTRLAESLARVCKHSLRMQKEVYDRRTECERRSQALSYLNRSAVNFILDEAPCSPGDGSDRETDDLPCPGEVCALVPSDASEKDPDVLLAKVLKYAADGKSARLAWLKEIETRPTFFEFQTGSDVWQENVSALIYPVDVVYDRCEGTYELRTPKERLFSMIKK